MKVLNNYIKEGKLELNKITLPGHQRGASKDITRFLGNQNSLISHIVINEVVLHNDCLHKNAKRQVHHNKFSHHMVPRKEQYV